MVAWRTYPHLKVPPFRAKFLVDIPKLSKFLTTQSQKKSRFKTSTEPELKFIFHFLLLTLRDKKSDNKKDFLDN